MGKIRSLYVPPYKCVLSLYMALYRINTKNDRVQFWLERVSLLLNF